MIILEDTPRNNKVGKKRSLKYESAQILELLAHFANPKSAVSKSLFGLYLIY